MKRLVWDSGRGARLVEVSDSPLPPSLDTSRIPATVGAAIAPPLVADLDGDGINEVLLYREARVQIYRYDPKHGLVAKES